MKKIFLFLILSVASCYAYYENGGMARVMALGEPAIAISDITSNIDLFAFGFTAAAPFIMKKNFISLNFGFIPGFVKEYYKNTQNTEFFINGIAYKTNNLFYKFSDNIIILNFNANSFFSETKELNEEQDLYNNFKKEKSFSIAGISYARKLFDNFVVGFSFKDNYFFEKNENNFSTGIENNDAEITENETIVFSKTTYSFSVCNYINEKLKIAFSMDNNGFDNTYENGIYPLEFYDINGTKFDYENLFLRRLDLIYVKDSLSSEIIKDENIYLKEEFENSGNFFKAGVEYNNDRTLVSVNSGIAVDFKLKYKKYYLSEIDYHYFPVKKFEQILPQFDILFNSIAYMANIAMRHRINNIINFSAIFNYLFFGSDYKNNDKLFNIKFSQLDLISGFCFSLSSFTLPVELIVKKLFADEINSNSNEINKSKNIYGIKIGCEYDAGNNIFLRTGFNFFQEGADYTERNFNDIREPDTHGIHSPYTPD